MSNQKKNKYWIEFTIGLLLILLCFIIPEILNLTYQPSQISNLLGTIITILAGTMAIFVSLTFLIIQIVGSTFSRRVTQDFWEKSHIIWLMFLYLIAIIISLCIQWMIPEESDIIDTNIIMISKVWIGICFVILLIIIPFISRMKSLLDPLALTELLLKKISTKDISPDNDVSFQAISDIFITSVEKNDVRLINDITIKLSKYFSELECDKQKRYFKEFYNLVEEGVWISCKKEYGRMLLVLVKALSQTRKSKTQNQDIRRFSLQKISSIEEVLWNTPFTDSLLQCLDSYQIESSDEKETRNTAISVLYNNKRLEKIIEPEEILLKRIYDVTLHILEKSGHDINQVDKVVYKSLPVLKTCFFRELERPQNSTTFESFLEKLSTCLFTNMQEIKKEWLSDLIIFLDETGIKAIDKTGKKPERWIILLRRLAEYSVKINYDTGVKEATQTLNHFQEHQCNSGKGKPEDFSGHFRDFEKIKKRLSDPRGSEYLNI